MNGVRRSRGIGPGAIAGLTLLLVFGFGDARAASTKGRYAVGGGKVRTVATVSRSASSKGEILANLKLAR